MVMKSCPECAKEISDKAPACPHCGARKPKSRVWLYVVIGLPVAFLAFGAMQPGDPERRQAEDSIKECWGQQEKKSNDGGTARFIAGACEMMEEKYVTKYGRKP